MSNLVPGLTPWKRSEAESLLLELKEALFPHWAIALSGSLLFNDTGNDLDLIVFPWDGSNFNCPTVHSILTKFGMKRTRMVDQMHEFWRKKGSKDNKKVEVYHWNDKRIDVFF